jgi:hypothetical protein
MEFRPNRITLPRVHQYNAAVQKQFGNIANVEVAYVGNIGDRVYPGETFGYNLNEQTLPKSSADIAAGPDASGRVPYEGKFTGTYNGIATVCCNSGTGMTDAGPVGRAVYNALQTKVDKRLSKGLSVNANYSWSSAKNYGNDAAFAQYKHLASWGRNDTNRSQILVVSSVYALPFGKGQKFLANNSRVMDLLVGGYTISGQSTWESGRPFTPTYQECGSDQDLDNNYANPGTTSDCRPNGSASDFKLSTGGLNPTAHDRTYFTPVAALTSNGATSGSFSRPSFGTFGNVGRNSLVGPRDFYTDMSLIKDFPVTEQIKGQFQVQAFNFFNHAALDLPTATNSRCIDCTAAQGAGLITGLEGNSTMRRLQFAAKFTF